MEFSVEFNSLTFPPAASDTLSIVFSPNGGGARDGHIILQHNVYSSSDTINVGGTALDYDTTLIDLKTGWNLVTVPRLVINDSASVLFPSGISDAFGYVGALGYQTSSTLRNGVGYWMKVGSPCSVPITGITITTDTIDVHAGWNLIGSVSVRHPVTEIIQEPVEIVTSNYFGFDGSYKTVAILELGKAYWVKVNGDGKLILSSDYH
jgi:hypothetical protein